jgi:lipopolysaccharide biosynthesis glycosyltransferase
MYVHNTQWGNRDKRVHCAYRRLNKLKEKCKAEISNIDLDCDKHERLSNTKTIQTVTTLRLFLPAATLESSPMVAASSPSLLVRRSLL